MSQQTNGTPELNYSKEAFDDMYEALEAWSELIAMRPLDSGADIDAILVKCEGITDKALAKAEVK